MHTPDVTQLQDKMLDRYRLIQPLGKGGMGEVWQAEDTELARHVAIKLLLPVLRNEEDYLRAFANEARLASLLDHPHILPVHDFGEVSIDDDVVITYLVLPLIKGGSLRDLIRTHTGILPHTLSLRYLRQAAEAIDFAHSQALLHRDIKPANMLLDDTWLFLSDFGLAKLLTTKTYRSRTHAGAGTPEYMAPEQIQKQAEAASDRYSLAMVAYQLLAGRLPFQASNPYEVFVQQLYQDPPSPRQFNPHLPPEVDAILLKGLAKNPAERYPSCQAFVAALEEQYQGREIPSTVYDAYATLYDAYATINEHAEIDQQPATSATDMAQQATSENHSYTLSPMQSHPPKKISRRTFLISSAATAIFLAGSGAALLATMAQNNRRVGPHQLIPGIPLLKLTRHTDAVTSVHWHPQGRYLTSTSLDTQLAIWDITTALTQHTPDPPMLKSWKFAHAIDGNSISWSPDGQTLVISHGGDQATSDKTLSGSVNILPVVSQQPITSYNDERSDYNNQPFTSLSCSPDGKWIATTMKTEIAALWQTGHTQAIAKILHSVNTPTTNTLNSSQPYIVTLAWSSDTTFLAGWRSDFKLVLWQPAISAAPSTMIALPSRSPHDDVNQLVVWFGSTSMPQVSLLWSPMTSPGAANLLAVSMVDIIYVVDQQSKKIVHLLGTNDPTSKQTRIINDTLYNPQITCLTWSSNGRYIAGSYLTGKHIFVWDLYNPHAQIQKGLHLPDTTIGQHEGHSDSILGLAWSPDGRYLASSSFDKSIIIWQVDNE